jgi:hypothetical protein
VKSRSLQAKVESLLAKAEDNRTQIADLKTDANKWHAAKHCWFQRKQYPKVCALNRNKWAQIWLGFALTLVPKLSMYQAKQFIVFLMTMLFQSLME